MSLRLISLALFGCTFATPLNKAARDACNPCNPQGATGSNPPSIGPDLSSLYADILASVKDIHFNKRWAGPVGVRDDGFCCAETLDCVNVQNLNIPMCYDKFTTNFAFADRSYGSLTTGNYTQGGSDANLLTGQYSKDGSEGNIYSDNPSAKPNTATLSIPPQWTGPGVGSAIPATAIVGSATAPAQTSAQTTAPGRIPATTVSVTSQSTGSATSASAQNSEVASSTPSKGTAIQGTPTSGTSLIMSVLAALMYIM